MPKIHIPYAFCTMVKLDLPASSSIRLVYVIFFPLIWGLESCGCPMAMAWTVDLEDNDVNGWTTSSWNINLCITEQVPSILHCYASELILFAKICTSLICKPFAHIPTTKYPVPIFAFIRPNIFKFLNGQSIEKKLDPIFFWFNLWVGPKHINFLFLEA